MSTAILKSEDTRNQRSRGSLELLLPRPPGHGGISVWLVSAQGIGLNFILQYFFSRICEQFKHLVEVVDGSQERRDRFRTSV